MVAVVGFSFGLRGLLWRSHPHCAALLTSHGSKPFTVPTRLALPTYLLFYLMRSYGDLGMVMSTQSARLAKGTLSSLPLPFGGGGWTHIGR